MPSSGSWMTCRDAVKVSTNGNVGGAMTSG